MSARIIIRWQAAEINSLFERQERLSVAEIVQPPSISEAAARGCWYVGSLYLPEEVPKKVYLEDAKTVLRIQQILRAG